MLLTSFPHDLIRGGKAGRLTGYVQYQTPIRGYGVTLQEQVGKWWVDCTLSPSGILTVRPDTQWDFGSGPAVDTPAMVRASLAHDVLCHMTNLGLLPWSCRAQADHYLGVVLKQFGAGFSRLWRIPAVRLYSTLIARWKDRK